MKKLKAEIKKRRKKESNNIFSKRDWKGKNNFVNSFVNVSMGVIMGLSLRYEIVSENESNLSQAQSQTQDVKIYHIKTKDGKLYQIIDTPGYGDVRGISQDKIITEKYLKLLRKNCIQLMIYVLLQDLVHLD